jgi:hypothetical protein
VSQTKGFKTVDYYNYQIMYYCFEIENYNNYNNIMYTILSIRSINVIYFNNRICDSSLFTINITRKKEIFRCQL